MPCNVDFNDCFVLFHGIPFRQKLSRKFEIFLKKTPIGSASCPCMFGRDMTMAQKEEEKRREGESNDCGEKTGFVRRGK